MDLATGLATLNTELGDSNNFALTADEKTRALTRAWNDSYVVAEDWDDSLTYQDNTNSYAVPTGLGNFHSIHQDVDDTNQFKKEIPKAAYNVRAGNIYFQDGYRQLLRDGKTLYLYTHKKLTTSDSITAANLQEYVLALANIYAINVLINKGTFKFLKNDTSVAELIAHKRELEQVVEDYRNQQRKEFQAV